jgi:hypothetical protein
MSSSLENRVLIRQSQIHNYLLTNRNWKEDVDKEILKGKKRIFHTLFESPGECFKDDISIQVLSEDELHRLYPHLVSNLLIIPQNRYAYIFCCKNVMNGGKNPFIMKSYV